MAIALFLAQSRIGWPSRLVVLAGVSLLGSIGTLACSSEAPGEPPRGAATQRSPKLRLRVEPARLTSSPAIPVGRLHVYAPGDGRSPALRPEDVTFRSSDEAIVRVSSDGEVHYLQPGIATIIVTSEGGETNVPVEVRAPPIALVVTQVSSAGAAIVVDKLEPGQKFRLFGSTDPEKGVTRVPDCLRLDLGMKDATVLAEFQLTDEKAGYLEAIVPLPEGVLALQVVSDDCAISPVAPTLQ